MSDGKKISIKREINMQAKSRFSTFNYRPPIYNDKVVLKNIMKAIQLGLTNEFSVKQYSDTKTIYDAGRHTLIIGRTGAGKTSFLLNFLLKQLDNGFKVLFRDDGGMEFLYLLNYGVPMDIFIPRGCKLKIKGHSDLVNILHYDIDNPLMIIQYGINSGKPFTAILFDVYNVEPELSAIFWSAFFKNLIHFAMQNKQKLKQQKVIVSIDELNDLVQGQGKELTNAHKHVKSFIAYNIRKLRKFNISLVATSHGPMEIPKNIRTQFSYNIVKQIEASDIYDYLNRKLIRVKSKTFWGILADITEMSEQYFWLFDYQGHYDKFYFEDIKRKPDIKYETIGMVSYPSKEKRFDEKDLIIALMRAMKKPFKEIAKVIGLSVSSTYERYEKLLKIDKIGILVKQLENTKQPKQKN
ncbi:MAG: hypothetical protein J7L47_04980 [Candidatus Odinarchaeota archaeon]|nr:hypothetical protein [Candidatus Odinarchaeota archaeon]